MNTKRLAFPLFSLILMTAIGCSSGESDATDTTPGVRFTSAASFSASAAALTARIKAATTGQCEDLDSDTGMDDPILEDGLDCDGDGGEVTHVTPSQYSIAIKRVAMIAQNEDSLESIEFIPDTGTLAQSQVLTFTDANSSENVITIDPNDLVSGIYSGIEIEIYYFELTFPIGGTTQNVRIYMSDDDFEAEGNLGHHQGDITFIDDEGNELGWIDNTWLGENLSDTRGVAQNGAGGTDEETGHDRGFFGDADLWDRENLQQGSDQDIFIYSIEFNDPVVIPDPSLITGLTTITATFSVADTFYFEDFDPQDGTFSPGDGGEASSEGAEWAPLPPTATLSVE